MPRPPVLGLVFFVFLGQRSVCAFSDWKPGQAPEAVLATRQATEGVKATDLLEKAAKHQWGEYEHGSSVEPFGDITAHEFDLTHNKGDGSDSNLWINANLTTYPPNATADATVEVEPVLTTEQCPPGPDLHGLVCKLVFSDWIGVEVVCVCKDACKGINFTDSACSKAWAHILMELVEEDTGCTEYTGQLTVPGFWGKCRPASAVLNPTPPEVTAFAAESVVGGSNYHPGGGYKLNLLQGKSGNVKVAPKVAELRGVELLKSQLDTLNSQREGLLKQKDAWLIEREKLLSERKELGATHAKLMASAL